MSRRSRKVWLICSLAVLAVLFSTALWAKNPALFGAGGSKKEQKAASTAQLPANLTPGQVDQYLATLSDQQARQALAQKLKEETAAKPAKEAPASPTIGRESPIGRLFMAATKGVSSGFERLRTFSSRAAESAGTLSSAFDTITRGKGASQLVMSVLSLLAIIGAGLVAERVFIRATEGIRHQLLTAMPLGRLQKLGLIISRMLLEAVGVALYVLVTFLLFVLAYGEEDAGYSLVCLYLIGSYYFKILMFAFKVVLAPRATGLRLFPLADEDARFLYRWMLWMAVAAVVIAPVSSVFKEAGVSQELYSLMYCAGGVTVILLLIAMICQSRRRVALAICPEREPGAGSATSLPTTVAKSWHVLAILYVLVIGSFWVVQELTGGRITIRNMLVSLFLIPIFIAIDQWAQRLLKVASGELPEIIDLSGDGEKTADERSVESRADFKYYVPAIRRLFRGVLLAFLFFVTLRLWGVDLAVGRLFTSHVLSIVVALLLGFIVWEVTKARIDAKLREELPEEGEEMDEGGEGGTRRGTLLVLLRKFILTVVFITVGLIILSSIGVNIGPLIAGAGVIGIAIGFGAQTLVRDIISGIFYLLDDAFRVGDYVESAGAKGTVEQISLRSLKLRHPRGMVYTIPYGRMGAITNHSRDYNITKLDVRLRFDTDLDKVKKIIKRLNKEIMKDEEFKSVLLDDIRSQGVRELDDSAMILRVKFKTLPGKQFVLRREVYQRLQRAFRENGIQFAHRDVTVYLPPELRHSVPQPGEKEGGQASPGSDKALLGVAAAAARAVALADEEKKKAELESKKPKGEG